MGTSTKRKSNQDNGKRKKGNEKERKEIWGKGAETTKEKGTTNRKVTTQRVNKKRVNQE